MARRRLHLAVPLAAALILAGWSLSARPAGAAGQAGDDGEGRVQRVTRETVPRVVKIFGASGFAKLPGYSSGVLISPDGRILTQKSVLLGARKLQVVLWDGRVFPGKVLRSDPERQVSLIKIDVPGGEELPHFDMADPGPLRIGQWVLSVGNAYKLAHGDEWPSANLGIVSAITRLDLRLGLGDFEYDGDVIITDASNNPGSFGGALVDLRGRLVGINGRIVESKATNTQISYAIPIGDLVPLVDGTIILEKKAREAARVPGRHGIRLFDPRWRKSTEAYIERVAIGSPAGRAKLRKNDLVIQIDQTRVRSCDEFHEIMGRYGPGDSVVITVERSGEVVQATLVLAAPPGAPPGDEAVPPPADDTQDADDAEEKE